MSEDDINKQIAELNERFFKIQFGEIDDEKHLLKEQLTLSFQQISQELNQILERYPDNINAISLKIDLLIYKKCMKEANFWGDKLLAICGRILISKPDDFSAIFAKLTVLDELKRKKEYNKFVQDCLDYFDCKLAANPNDADLLENKAMFLTVIKRDKEALEIYNQLLQSDPTNERYRLGADMAVIEIKSPSLKGNDYLWIIISILVVLYYLYQFVCDILQR